MPKSAFVAIVGRPSSGKSTLLNALCGAKVAIVSPIPQTTRNSIRGIVTRPEGQLVFVDTPGYHLSDRKFNKKLQELVVQALSEVDIVLYLVDATRDPGPEEEALLTLLKEHSNHLIIAINKIDDADSKPLIMEEFLASRLKEARRIKISALKQQNLDQLLSLLFELAEEGPLWYPEDIYTDQEPVFRIAEIVREKAMLHTRQELPHAIAVEYRESSRKPDGSLLARYDIIVERDSQKAIVIGKKGSVIQSIREEAEAELAELFDYPVKLSLQVVVDPDWRKDDKRLASMIF
ncbi:MAG: GTPase Era [Rectinemataceae bacterium]|nr:GTPase Era [Spirochaetaceae bacterium]